MYVPYHNINGVCGVEKPRADAHKLLDGEEEGKHEDRGRTVGRRQAARSFLKTSIVFIRGVTCVGRKGNQLSRTFWKGED